MLLLTGSDQASSLSDSKSRRERQNPPPSISKVSKERPFFSSCCFCYSTIYASGKNPRQDKRLPLPLPPSTIWDVLVAQPIGSTCLCGYDKTNTDSCRQNFNSLVECKVSIRLCPRSHYTRTGHLLSFTCSAYPVEPEAYDPASGLLFWW